MKNAIVYSLHVFDSIYENLNIYQFKYSLDTVLKYNSNIPIKVYLSPISLKNSGYELPQEKNVEYIYFDATSDPRLDSQILSTYTSHKWQVSFEALKDYDLDNVMYVDMDTFFQKNPEYLFEKYGNSNSIYAKITPFGQEYVDLFKIKDGMNDGTFILNKNILDHKDKILAGRNDYVYKFQEELKKNKQDPEFDKKMSWIQWAACQFGVSEYMKEIGNPIRNFEDSDISLVNDWEANNRSSDVCIVHYFNYNTYNFVPEKYNLPQKYKEIFANKTGWSK